MIKKCPKCKSEHIWKAGKAWDKIRYRCKDCNYQFTKFVLHDKNKPANLRKQAIQMSIEGMGFRVIGRVLGVHNTTVINWVRKER